MSEFTERKVMYYNRDIRFLDTHCHVILSIFLIINLVRVAVHIFVQKAGMTLELAAIIAYILLLILSILSYSLLDKMTFIINVMCGCYQILVRVVVSVVSISVTVSEFLVVRRGEGGKMGEFIAGALMIQTLIIIAITVAITIYYVIALRNFFKHQKLFFSSLKELKTEYTQE